MGASFSSFYSNFNNSIFLKDLSVAPPTRICNPRYLFVRRGVQLVRRVFLISLSTSRDPTFLVHFGNYYLNKSDCPGWKMCLHSYLAIDGILALWRNRRCFLNGNKPWWKKLTEPLRLTFIFSNVDIATRKTRKKINKMIFLGKIRCYSTLDPIRF